MNTKISKSRGAIVLIAAAILAVSVIAGVHGVHALGHGGSRGGGFGGLKMLMQLDLSDAQKARIRDMLPAYRTAKDARQDSLRAMRQQMRSLVEAERFDEDAVRRAFREMAPLMEDMAVLKAQFMHDLKAMLTAEQIARVKAKHARRENRRDEDRRVRDSMLDTWLSTPAESTSVQ